MSSTFTVLVNQVLSMFLMLAVGYIAYRTKLITEGGVGDLSRTVMYIASPCLMMASFIQPFDGTHLMNAGLCAVLSVAVLAICALVAHVAYGKKDPISQFGVIFSNTGFVGIPLVQHVLGQSYVFYVTVCIAVLTFLIWTYGVYLVTGNTKEISLKKVFTNPAVVTLFIGFAFFLFSVPVPDFISGSLDTLGEVNTGLAMVVLGCYLAQTRLSLIVRDLRAYKVSVLRLIVAPLLTLLLLWLVPSALVPSDIKMVVLITFSTPIGAMVAMLSQKYGANYEYGAGIVSLSTLLSLVSMPIILGIGAAIL